MIQVADGGKMVDVEEAVLKAKVEINKLFPDFASHDLRLEEAETPLSGSRWRLTFSAAVAEEPSGNALVDLVRPKRKRKTVELHPDSGELMAIKAA